MFYNARWYDSALGRFAQADTIVPSAGKSQAWDRYAYVSNNPLRYTDPTGHREECGTKIGEQICSSYYAGVHTTRLTKEQREYYNKASDPINFLTAAGPGLLLESAVVFVPVEAILSSSFSLPILGNASMGGVASAISYVFISYTTGQPVTPGGVGGAITVGAISGTVGTVATPLAGSMLKPIGISVNVGTALVNGLGGAAAYHYGGAMENVVNADLGYKPSFEPSSNGYASSFVIPAILSPIASSHFPVRSVNSLNQASNFIPGRTANTWLRPNNLHQQNMFSIIAGALLGDAFGGN